VRAIRAPGRRSSAEVVEDADGASLEEALELNSWNEDAPSEPDEAQLVADLGIKRVTADTDARGGFVDRQR
jgi:hypothetical protein